MVKRVARLSWFVLLLIAISAADFSVGKYKVWTSHLDQFPCSMKYPSKWKVKSEQGSVAFDNGYGTIRLLTHTTRDTSVQQLNRDDFFSMRHGTEIIARGFGHTKEHLEYYWQLNKKTKSLTRPVKPALYTLTYSYLHKGYLYEIICTARGSEFNKNKTKFHTCGRSLKID